MEFSINDYEQARATADLIKGNADRIMEIFNGIDQDMKVLYGDMWQSSGADVSNGRYQELRTNYEVFYEKVVAMRNHIYSVASSDQTADVNVSGNIAGI